MTASVLSVTSSSTLRVRSCCPARLRGASALAVSLALLVLRDPPEAFAGRPPPPSRRSQLSARSAWAARRGPKDVNWSAAKCKGLPLTELVRNLALELQERSWFVTGDVPAQYFATDFMHVSSQQAQVTALMDASLMDGDKRLEGIRNYAEEVSERFDPDGTRMDILNISITGEEEFKVCWRVEGFSAAPRLPLKAHTIESTFRVGMSGLVEYQRDVPSTAPWDLQLSGVVPWLPGLSAGAAPVERPYVVPESFARFVGGT
eukprot:CAMPEP_0171076322 /NCGR_PEP_ID=MMETSP0766_2-20121228/13340_1 /TAXON_ID=439317 /ORGANISM="Gambierdiscus australes, Strain CAWD 149" /LENGTH=260 /DNA_ID=CAMNT_0011533285 /DNA_START=27 /DNA_END=809 /DNA_ORIENTATION=-